MEIHYSDKIPPGWDDLVKSCEWGSFYQSSINLWLIETLTCGKPYFIFSTENGVLTGGIAYTVHDGPEGKVVNALPYYGSYGSAVLRADSGVGLEKGLYQAFLARCKELDAICATVITSPFATEEHHRNVKLALNPTFTDPRICQISRLPEYAGESQDAYFERLMLGFEGRARTAYRKIIKTNFTLARCETESDALAFFAIHRENIKAKNGIFKIEDFFRGVFRRSMEKPEDVEIAIVKDGDTLVGGVILFYWGNTVEYHSTCLKDDYRSIGPLNKIIVEKMLEAGMKGYKYWNFGGTWKSQEGVYNFKKSFGAQDHPYFYYTVFFKKLDKIRKMSQDELLTGYPLCFVIPFSELAKDTP